MRPVVVAQRSDPLHHDETAVFHADLGDDAVRHRPSVVERETDASADERGGRSRGSGSRGEESSVLLRCADISDFLSFRQQSSVKNALRRLNQVGEAARVRGARENPAS